MLAHLRGPAIGALVAECLPACGMLGATRSNTTAPLLLPLGCPLQQPMTRRDFASEADWEEYQASGMPSRQAEGRAKVVSYTALI